MTFPRASRFPWVAWWALWLVLTALLVACAQVPGTGRTQLRLIPLDQEIAMGVAEFQRLKAQQPILRDPRVQAEVRAVGERIAAVAPLPGAQWEFVVFDAPKVANAFCLPGGKVGVYSGLLPYTRDAGGLATVIGHEVAHAAAHHGAERLSQLMLVELGGLFLDQLLGDVPEQRRRLIQMAYGVGTTLAVVLPYSRRQELEADRLGLMYMARAGFDPRAALAFWRRFAEAGGPSPPEFLSTHPADEHRIAQLERLMPQALEIYRQAKASSDLDVPGFVADPVGVGVGVADAHVTQVDEALVFARAGELGGEIELAEAHLAHVEVADAVE